MPESDQEPTPASPTSQRGARLDSWKEIAAYLNRDVTTVRRWEKRERLPVHRHRHAVQGSVYAFTGEIDAWQSGREHLRTPEEPSRSGTRPALVGREREMQRLRSHLQRALDGTRRTVFIAGELGIGKTSLVQSFLDSARSEVWAAEGQCVEHYGRAEPYLPIVDGLERLVRDPRYPEAIRVVEDCAPSWLDQLSLSARARPRGRTARNPEPSPGQMAAELTDAIEALAAVKPLVLVLEDLHWSDHATVELIARVGRRPDRARLLVIGTYRLADLVDAGSPLLRVCRELRAHFQADEIELPQLTAGAIGELIARGRRWNDLSGSAARLRQWSGNPLFILHLLEHLERSGRMRDRDGEWNLELETGGPAFVPDKLRMLVEDQVDRLAPEHRHLLESASVIGDAFPAAIVAHTAQRDVMAVERALEDLCSRSHLVLRRNPMALPDGTSSASYAFVHEFYRRVVYERLPNATLTGLHRAVGTCLERGYGERGPEIAAELAAHFDQGRDLPRAVTHYTIAAENALTRSADREAQLALSRASELVVQQLPGAERDGMEQRLRAQLDAVLQRLAGDASWMKADTKSLADSLVALSSFHAVSGDLQAAREIGDRAATIARIRRERLFEATVRQAIVRLLVGEFQAGRELARALHVTDYASASPSDETRCSLVIAWSSWCLGDYDESRRALERIAPNEGAERLSSAAAVAALWEWLGESDKALAFLGPEHMKRPHATGDTRPSDAVRGWLLLRRGTARGLTLLRDGTQTLRQLGMQSWLPPALSWLAEGLLLNRRPDDARAAAEEGLNLVRRTGARCADSELYRLRGEAMLAQRSTSDVKPVANRDAAEASFWAGITVARQQEARTLELRATVSLARLLLNDGRREEARHALEPVYGTFLSGVITPDVAAAGTLLDDAQASSPKPPA